jgi:hypothetical protein
MASSTLTQFRGLNNVTDPARLGAEWLTRADNVNITETGGVVRRKGFSLALAGVMRSAFATQDFRRMFVHDGDAIKAVLPDTTAVPLVAGLGAEPVQWVETNDLIYYANSTDSGVIAQDGSVLPWRWPTPPEPTLSRISGSLPEGQYRACFTFLLPDGRETGAGTFASTDLAEGEALQISGIPQLDGLRTQVYVSPANSTVFQHAGTTTATAMTWGSNPDTLGTDLMTGFVDPLPLGVYLLAVWGGRFYAAQYLAEQDQTVVWWSEALAPHLWPLDDSFFLVPRRVTLLAPSKGGLLIGTGKEISAYDGEKLTPLTDYGAVPGWSWTADEERTYFWTQRGLCAFPEFENLTHARVSVAPGTQAGAALIHDEGQKRVVVAIQKGGTAFNPST